MTQKSNKPKVSPHTRRLHRAFSRAAQALYLALPDYYPISSIRIEAVTSSLTGEVELLPVARLKNDTEYHLRATENGLCSLIESVPQPSPMITDTVTRSAKQQSLASISKDFLAQMILANARERK